MDAKVKAALDSVYDFTKNHWGEVVATFKILEDMIGRKPPENAPPEVKALYGIFGKGDELATMRVFLSRNENGRNVFSKKEQDAIIGFLHWHFIQNRQHSPLGAVTVWWSMNAWRTFAMKLNSPAQKTGSVETIETEKIGKKTVNTKTVSDISSEAGNESVRFLKHVAKLINQAETPEAGYANVLRHFESLGVPTLPSPETLDWIENTFLNFQPWIAAIRGIPQRLEQWALNENKKTRREHRARAKRRPILGRLWNFVERIT